MPAYVHVASRGQPYCCDLHLCVSSKEIIIYTLPWSFTHRNPIGRTGMSGRGLLGRWGPNHAVDPIVTRSKDLIALYQRKGAVLRLLVESVVLQVEERF